MFSDILTIGRLHNAHLRFYMASDQIDEESSFVNIPEITIYRPLCSKIY